MTGLSRRAAVCGVGLVLGNPHRKNALGLAVDAYRIALEDAGLDRKDVDGIMLLSTGADYDRFLEAVGADVRYANQGWTHGRFTTAMLQHAAMVVASGQANTVAIVHGTQRRAIGQPQDHEMWRQGLGPHGESPAYGALAPVFGAAVAAQRYFHMYGGGSDDLAPIAVAFRKHAQLNPLALRREAMSTHDYLDSRWIVEPLRLFDCCQMNDNGACILITSRERARDCAKAPVYMAGMQGVHSGPQLHNLTLPGLGVAQQKVHRYEPTPEDLYSYEMAGLGPQDVDAFMTYDAFTPLVLFGLERFGFCGPGEARSFVKGGRIELGGELPINTAGGLLSEGHAAGWNMHIEAVRQLRRECGLRQVKDASVIQYGSFLGDSMIYTRQ